jgi:hypothetical protein
MIKSLLLILLPVWGLSQDIKGKDSLEIRFIYTETEVKDPSQLILKVAYLNNTHEYLEMYSYLDEGDRNDRFYNINIEMKRHICE